METLNLYAERTEPQIRNLLREYTNRTPIVCYKYGNYLRQKAIDDARTRASLVLGVTGSLGAVPSSKILEKQRRDWIVQQRLEKNVVEDFEYYRSPVYKPMSRDVEGPYTVNANPNREVEIQLNGKLKIIKIPRIQKVIYQGREIFFGITEQNHLVMYSVIEQEGERQMIVHAVERIYNHQNTTAYLKNKARKTLLELIKRNNNNILPFRTPIVQVREAA